MEATNAEHGIVSTHAQTISPATPQRTAFRLVTDPTPAIDPAITCVVDTGSPRNVGRKIEIAAPVSAQNPLRGFNRVRRDPIVLTMRQPPLSVPRLIAVLAAAMTQGLTWLSL